MKEIVKRDIFQSIGRNSTHPSPPCRFGRRPVMVWGSVLYTLVAVLSVWIRSFPLVLAARFILGLGHMTQLKTNYILGEDRGGVGGRGGIYNVFDLHCDGFTKRNGEFLVSKYEVIFTRRRKLREVYSNFFGVNAIMIISQFTEPASSGPVRVV